jgi:hypothetical protein
LKRAKNAVSLTENEKNLKKKKKVYTEILGLKTLVKAELPLTFGPP